MWKFLLMIVCVLILTAIQANPTYKECGVRENTKQTRVVNGTESSEFQWPWMAFINLTLIHEKDAFCGGTLIGKRHILTAAHCIVKLHNEEFKSVDPGLINVTLGAHNVSKDGERYRVAEVRRHPGFNESYLLDYDFNGAINDIVVLILDRDVKLSKDVIPICLPDDHSKISFESWSALVLGWGLTTYGGNESDVLREANVTIWKNDKCHEDVEKFIRIHENKICAGGRINEGRGGCHGDSGGPLMVYDNGKWIETGIAESVPFCGKRGHPTVFTRVTEYLGWIKEQMSTALTSAEMSIEIRLTID